MLANGMIVCILWILMHVGSAEDYGVDVSFPIHYGIDPNVHPLQAQRYQRFIDGCAKVHGRKPCVLAEKERLRMNRQQPATHYNYTALGFHKTSTPTAMFNSLLSYFQKHRDEETIENTIEGGVDTYINSWEAANTMVNLEATAEGFALKDAIWSEMQPIIEAWVGYDVEPVSLYGIRVYKDGNILATHVDRLPLVSSAIIQVAQDVDEPWPLEVYDHAGRAHNVSMLPGDLVLYESHTVLHGRPFPLKGRYYANVFVHFKPRAHDQLNAESNLEGWDALTSPIASTDDHLRNEDPDDFDKTAYEKSIHERMADIRARHHVPSAEPVAHLLNMDIDDNLNDLDFDLDSEMDVFLQAIADGDTEKALELADSHPELLAVSDELGWTAFHEAVRAGNTALVRQLLLRGVNPKQLTDAGEHAYYIALDHLPKGHDLLEILYDLICDDYDCSEGSHDPPIGTEEL